jgi:integrase
MSGTGNITRRGKHSWRLKFDTGRDMVTGERDTQFVTVRGTKKEAQAELTRLLAAHDAGTAVAPSKATVATYMATWIDTAETLSLAAKTAERYRYLIDQQITPHLGAHPLQKLKAAHIAEWHATLLSRGGHAGAPLSARTVGHAHRVLHKALGDAVKREVLNRNPAALVPPPKVVEGEMAMLGADAVKALLVAMRGTVIYPHVVTLLSTGMRRGELMGLQWGDVDLDGGKLRIERAIEKTKKHGLRVKGPKTRHGRRTITLPAGAVAVLRQHRKAQLETRVALGLGRLPDDAFVFGTLEGGMRDPGAISQAWKRLVATGRLPKTTLHALRHSHASALIASGADPVTVSRRLGHGSPVITMSTYAHLFDRGDESAARAIDLMMNVGDV